MRWLRKKISLSGTVHTKETNHVTVETTQASNESKHPISDKIKRSDQDFWSNYKEFNLRLQEEEGEVLIKEFRYLTKVPDLESDLRKVFNTAAKHFKISVISKLDDYDYVKVFRHLEKKVSKSQCMIVLENQDSTGLALNTRPFPLIYLTNGLGLSILYKERIIKQFEKGEFCKCLSVLFAIYFVYNIPFNSVNEKILGFILESVSFPLQIHYHTKRSVAFLKLLNFVEQD